uniref:Uncharacterized protein n=1 Tax=Nelumbo nucifera TaxID=4432 RepID=A0A823A0T3_NELNU|nr:TPA_asm: hypothetical protein HUJ06_019112 [Nelumbo nucifera]
MSSFEPRRENQCDGSIPHQCDGGIPNRRVPIPKPSSTNTTSFPSIHAGAWHRRLIEMGSHLYQFRLSLLASLSLSLALLVHSGLNLDTSDFDALFLLHKDLGGFNGQHYLLENPCYSAAGIFCERRFSSDSPVPRITRIVLESQQLNGFLSPTIGHLTELRELSLSP